MLETAPSPSDDQVTTTTRNESANEKNDSDQNEDEESDENVEDEEASDESVEEEEEYEENDEEPFNDLWYEHFIAFDNEKSASRCKHCRKTTHVMCLKCSEGGDRVNLCLVRGRNCFNKYHGYKEGPE